MIDYSKYIADKLCDIYPENEIQALTRILLQEITGGQTPLFSSDKSKQLNAQQEGRLDDILLRLQKSEPLQYVLGQTEFYGLPFYVNEDVLIPRPETEELVEWIASEFWNQPLRILDIGTGSGCIAVTLAKKLLQATVEAWDISSKALAVAERNAAINKVKVTFRQLDVLNESSKIRGKFDVIVSNPPYVMNAEKEEMHHNVLNYEPHLALFVEDNDPLLFYRKIAELGNRLLLPQGKLYFEINAAKGKETVALLQTLGYSNVELRKDLSGNDRMVAATR